MRRFRLPTVIVGLLVGLIGFAITPQRCLACSCIPPPGQSEARDQAAAVFRGRVVASEQKRSADGYGYQQVTFQVATVWQGTVTREMIVYTGSGGGDCGYPFRQGQDYLVYASNVRASGPPQYFPAGALATGTCNRTKPLAQAGDDLTALGPGAPPADAPLPNLPNTGTGHPPTPLALLTPSLLAFLLLAAIFLYTGTLRRRKG